MPFARSNAIVPAGHDYPAVPHRYAMPMVESDVESGASSGFRMSAWIVLAATVGVVISGDIVQATESGAGCGESWPRCDGSLFPAFDDAATSIEFIHRAATSILSLLVVGLYIAARRSMEAGHRIRSAMNYVIVFLVVEVLVGALLVLFGWVEDDASFGRVVADGVHVINTFLLIGALVLVIHYAGGAIRPVWRPRTKRDRTILIGVALLLVIGVTGRDQLAGRYAFPCRFPSRRRPRRVRRSCPVSGAHTGDSSHCCDRWRICGLSHSPVTRK